MYKMKHFCIFSFLLYICAAQAQTPSAKPARVPALPKSKVVLLDYYFNRENRDGKRFHYTWEDTEDTGYALWGQTFRDLGAQTAALEEAPNAVNLSRANVYIVVDPDTKKENPSPNFIKPEHINAIKDWVRKGGTLVLLANDTANCEMERFNLLAGTFGVHFSNKNRNMVKNNQFEQGLIRVPVGHSVLPNTSNLFIKEMSILQLALPARPLLMDGSDIIMAIAPYGKGRVFALGDPWLYNEYVDQKKLPAEYDNHNAIRDLSNWLLTPPPPTSLETEAVEIAVEKLRQALLTRQRDILDQLTDAQLSYGHSNGKIEDKTAFLESLVSGRSRFTTIHLSDQRVVVHGNAATVRHIFTASTQDAGKGPDSIQLSVLLVWTKQAGQWRLLARQAIKI